jgi:hypothetical protein
MVKMAFSYELKIGKRWKQRHIFVIISKLKNKSSQTESISSKSQAGTKQLLDVLDATIWNTNKYKA